MESLVILRWLKFDIELRFWDICWSALGLNGSSFNSVVNRLVADLVFRGPFVSMIGLILIISLSACNNEFVSEEAG